MADLSADQKAYLNHIRTGFLTDCGFSVKPNITQGELDEFAMFAQFLKSNGHPDPQPADLHLQVKRETVLNTLHYAVQRNCLIIQACFGFNLPLNEGGQLQLIHKANMYKSDGNMLKSGNGTDDYTVFHTPYKEVRNGRKFFDLFLNMDTVNHLPVGVARQFIKNFRANYPGRTIAYKPFVLGYMFPVQAFIKLFNDPQSILSTADMITFRWGLGEQHEDGSIGNFSIVIGADNMEVGPFIGFSTPARFPLGGGRGLPPVPCPPNTGCQL